MGKRTPAVDERLVIGVRPHGRVLLGPVVTLFLLAPTVVVIAASVPDGRAAGVLRTMVLGAGSLVLGRACVVPFVQWWRTLYAVTDRRVVLRRGVVRRLDRHLPVDRVVEVDVWQSGWDRWLGCGQVRVVAGGGAPPMVLDDVPAVDQVVAALRRHAGLVPWDGVDAGPGDEDADEGPGDEGPGDEDAGDEGPDEGFDDGDADEGFDDEDADEGFDDGDADDGVVVDVRDDPFPPGDPAWRRRGRRWTGR